MFFRQIMLLLYLQPPFHALEFKFKPVYIFYQVLFTFAQHIFSPTNEIPPIFTIIVETLTKRNASVQYVLNKIVYYLLRFILFFIHIDKFTFKKHYQSCLLKSSTLNILLSVDSTVSHYY